MLPAEVVGHHVPGEKSLVAGGALGRFFQVAPFLVSLDTVPDLNRCLVRLHANLAVERWGSRLLGVPLALQLPANVCHFQPTLLSE